MIMRTEPGRPCTVLFSCILSKTSLSNGLYLCPPYQFSLWQSNRGQDGKPTPWIKNPTHWAAVFSAFILLPFQENIILKTCNDGDSTTSPGDLCGNWILLNVFSVHSSPGWLFIFDHELLCSTESRHYYPPWRLWTITAMLTYDFHPSLDTSSNRDYDN